LLTVYENATKLKQLSLAGKKVHKLLTFSFMLQFYTHLVYTTANREKHNSDVTLYLPHNNKMT